MGIWPGRVTCADREIHTCHTLLNITAHFEHWSNVRVVEVSLEIYKHIIFTAKVNLRFVGLSRFFADMKSFYVWMDFMREDAIFTTFYADTIHGNRCYEAMTTAITFLQIIFELFQGAFYSK